MAIKGKRSRTRTFELPKLPVEERLKNNREVNLTLTPEQAMEEASRCIECRTPACSVKGCPLHNHIRDWIILTAEGRFMEAAALSNETSNMPEVCSRLCPQERLCEGVCVVGIKGDSVAIGSIERFINDYARNHGGIPRPQRKPLTHQRVAVIGAGPAGISVADECAKEGHDVVIFDIWPEPGGLLRYGIPSFKMENDLVDEKFAYLYQLGVQFVGNTTIGKDKTIADLFNEGFDAVFLGNGAIQGKELKVEGVDMKGVELATPFLVCGNVPQEHRPEWLKDPLELTGKKIVVLGGGDTAMDCVRTALRNGAEKVTCVYRRNEENMPGSRKEVISAKEEGAQFEYFSSPERFVGNHGHVTGVECIRMELGEPDSSGRQSPIPIEGSNFVVDADIIILALGYDVDSGISDTTPEIKVDRWGCFIVDEETGATNLPGAFAAGDCVSGADLVVTAVAGARKAARGINQHLAKLAAQKVPEMTGSMLQEV